MDTKSVSEQLSLAAKLRERAEQELMRHHEQMQQELQMAADFQQAVLPREVDLSYLEISVLYRPYAKVSGDVYDFLQNREGELAIFLGDATGHGMAAALMTMMIHIGLDTIRRNLSTDESIRILNKLIAIRQTGRSVSGVFFRITPSGYLTVTHAGHPSLVIIPADGSDLVQFSDGGCALGLFEDEPVHYEEESYQLQEDDKVVAYTNALIAWSNREKEPFGLDRLLAALDRVREAPADTLSGLLMKELEQFSGGQPCEHDLTMLTIGYLGHSGHW